MIFTTYLVALLTSIKSKIQSSFVFPQVRAKLAIRAPTTTHTTKAIPRIVASNEATKPITATKRTY